MNVLVSLLLVLFVLCIIFYNDIFESPNTNYLVEKYDEYKQTHVDGVPIVREMTPNKCFGDQTYNVKEYWFNKEAPFTYGGYYNKPIISQSI